LLTAWVSGYFVFAVQDIEPTAVLLRGGDAVVMAGAARRCYHGVPRVMPEQAAAAAAEAEAEGGGGSGAFERHMARCRISISIRATA
jgi:alkylated DNA repair protein alkB family protein 1